MDEFEELKGVFIRVEASWHKYDDERFKKFLSIAKSNSLQPLTLGNFRGAFEEAQDGRLIDSLMDDKLQELYKKYIKTKKINNPPK